MLTKPGIPDELIISYLEKEYNLRTAELTFLPLGAGIGTAAYRVVAGDRTAYFLKLRKGFEEITVTVSLGIQEIMAPIQTKAGQGWRLRQGCRKGDALDRAAWLRESRQYNLRFYVTFCLS